MWEKRNGEYQSVSYEQIRKAAQEFAAGLIDLGVRKGDRIALMSEGRNDWVTAELGILYSGAVSVPLSVKLQVLEELSFRLAHSASSVAIVSGFQASKLVQIQEALPDLRHVIVLDPASQPLRAEQSFLEVIAKGRKLLMESPEILEERWRSLAEGDPASISYTSGTTADPKGIVLTHRNYTANVEQAAAALPVYAHYRSLLILPWDHSFTHTAGIYLLIRSGASMAAVETGGSPLEAIKNLPRNIREIQPNFLFSVPAIASNFRKNIERGIRARGRFTDWLFRRALSIAYRYDGSGHDRGRGWRCLLKPFRAACDRMLFAKIRQNFGGKLEFFIGGGALLDIELQRFFYALGIPMLQGYGLTEASPVISANVPLHHKLGSSGAILPGVEVKIVDSEGCSLPVEVPGEIVVRGENVMQGYWNNPAATADVLRDGWLHTGDRGYLDEDRFLYVLGREKSLLIGDDGEKFSPECIEETVVANSPYIEQILLYNDQCPYTVGLLVPNRAAILDWLASRGLSCRTAEGQQAVLDLLSSEINHYRVDGRAGGRFPTRWLPSVFAVLSEGFTEGNQLLNSTLKMVRPRIVDRYREELDRLYSPEGKADVREQNLAVVAGLERRRD